MRRHIQRIITSFEPSPTRSSPTRSPLSPIAIPNEVKPNRKSIRQVVLERKQKLSSPDCHILTTLSSTRRRTVKLWGSQRHPDSPTQRMVDGYANGAERRAQFKWVRGQTIGRGLHGRVYLGLNATTGEMIAVKQVSFPQRAGVAQGRLSADTLKRDMENMTALSHPNLVQYLGLEEEPEFVSIFMEYVPFGSIRDNVHKRGKFSEDVVKSFVSQILDGLVYLHARGIIHGELKSSNILVDGKGTCKIEGLGCSETQIRDSSREVPCAIFWTAPEIVRTQYKAYTAMADIWSVGCVMLEMCTGSRPWFGVEAVAVLFKLYHQTLRPRPPADIVLNHLAEDLMEKCLTLKPDERMTAAQLKHSYLSPTPGWSFEGFN
ncbi:kinase-like domain-containing protein [Mycena epipterygia]|nr:kinase-like domain-containing protein [Mycena epipterygia]